MQPSPFPQVQDLVLIGGGHSHALILRMWGMNPLPGARLTVINPSPSAPYSGMLPGYVAGHYRRDEMMIDLCPLARFAGARLILDRVTGIDVSARQISLAGRGPMAFDVASVNVGITSDLPDLPGFSELGQSAKPLGGFAEAWAQFAATPRINPSVVILGGGVAGVELALAAMHRLSGTDNGSAAQVTVVERGPAILPLLGHRAAKALRAALDRAGVQVMTGVQAVGLTDGWVQLSDGQELASDFTLSAAGARAPDWLATSGLAVTDGFLTVGPTLQTSDPAIFAAGDCAHLSHAPRPKAGVFAVREAPVLLANMRTALIGAGRMQTYRPQRDYLKLISMGGRVALAEKAGLAAQGAHLWAWKDRIDRRFMARVGDLPAMPAPTIPAIAASGLREAIGTTPACAGCGAKVGSARLQAVLSGISAPLRADILSGPGDDAALLAHGAVQVQAITTDHLRSVSNYPHLMAQIAAVHALGDIWAMGASAQAALAQVILPPLSPDLQARTLAEIMAAATAVFRAAGADIVGGHSSLGAELTIGFTVTGLAPRVLAKGGAQPGDALILTKALGTGTILAAEMVRVRPQGQVLGDVVAQAHAAMIRPMGGDAALLTAHAHAMTDVTGFGLAGHLLEMLRAGGCGAEITLGTLPLLPGAVDLAAQGISSTLAPQNRSATIADMSFADMPSAALLFDPQTCGGLLVAVPADQAATLVAELRAQGAVDAAIIGRITDGPVHLRVIP